jgi:hypothetical protein
MGPVLVTDASSIFGNCDDFGLDLAGDLSQLLLHHRE